MMAFDGQYKKCLKCGHRRTATDEGPEWACPSCDAVYAKMEAAAAAKAARQSEEAQQREEREASRSHRAADLDARPSVPDPEEQRKLYAQVAYFLLASPFIASIFAGLGAHKSSSVGIFAMIAGVVLAYTMSNRNDGSWIDSHFRWQIRSFWRLIWWSVGLAVVGGAVGVAAAGHSLHNHQGDALHFWGSLGIWAVVLMVLAFAIGLAYIIRVVRGWIALNRGREIGV
jgi:uncharacterized membrane protein